MISIAGRWYDGKTSSVTEASLVVRDSGEMRVVPESGDPPLTVESGFEVRVSPRLADTPRYILFPGGGKFETFDNEAVDKILKRFGGNPFSSLIHRLENRWAYVLAALVVMLFFVWGGVKYGVPSLAEMIAHRLPDSAYRLASEQTLDILDRALLQPSELEDSVRSGVEEHFHVVLNDHADLELKVLFRKGPGLGPNAFALPDGTILFTDEMVLAAWHHDELSAVLAHEIGHVVHRHGMRRVIQGSILGFAIMALTGDVSGASEIFLALPAILTELSYSREFEREADRYALDYMRSRDISPAHFVRLMERIREKEASRGKNRKGEWRSYLSTHPSIEERIELFGE